MINNKYADFIHKNINRFGVHIFVYCLFMSIEHISEIFLRPNESYSAIPKVLEAITLYGIFIIFGLSYLEYRGFNGKKILKRAFLIIVIPTLLIGICGSLMRYFGPSDPATEALAEKWGDYGDKIWWIP